MGNQLDLDLRQALASRYSVERELGRGGMGAVYLARDLVLERPVALKVLHWQLESAVTRERFLREARIAATLAHPNIVPIYAVEEVGAWVVLAMQYVDGGTLAAQVTLRGPLSGERTAAVLRDLALALAHSHRRGVVHRDVKPENILLDSETGRVMLADFGIAFDPGRSALTDAGQLIGTPHFMSPEQARGEPADACSDIYALGLVAHFCLRGHPPFTGDDPRAVLSQHLSVAVPALRSVAPEASPQLAEVVDRCLRKEPEERHTDAEQLAAALDLGVSVQQRLPTTLAVLVGDGNELTLRQTIAAPLLGSGMFAMVDFLLNPYFNVGPWVVDLDAGMAVGLVAPFVIYGGRRIQLLRKAGRAGYDAAALGDALGTAMNRASMGEGRDRALRILAQIMIAAVLLLISGMLLAKSIRWNSIDNWTLDDKIFMALLLITTAVSVAGPMVELLAPQSQPMLGFRAWFWNSAIGRMLFRMVNVGMRSRAIPEYAARQTEAAIGSAAMVLFEALPRELRRRLDRLPVTIRELERSASRYRQRLSELEQMPLPDGPVGDDPALRERREAVETDLRTARERATRRLRSVLTALEILRLDLLRLHAREADVASITAGLEAAMRIGEEIDRDEAAQRELTSYLAVSTPS